LSSISSASRSLGFPGAAKNGPRKPLRLFSGTYTTPFGLSVALVLPPLGIWPWEFSFGGSQGTRKAPPSGCGAAGGREYFIVGTGGDGRYRRLWRLGPGAIEHRQFCGCNQVKADVQRGGAGPLASSAGRGSPPGRPGRGGWPSGIRCGPEIATRGGQAAGLAL
jgi:hypothetical protein